jgi:hypothetical protein
MKPQIPELLRSELLQTMQTLTHALLLLPQTSLILSIFASDTSKLALGNSSASLGIMSARKRISVRILKTQLPLVSLLGLKAVDVDQH